jgi:hypothetical protein
MPFDYGEVLLTSIITLVWLVGGTAAIFAIEEGSGPAWRKEVLPDLIIAGFGVWYFVSFLHLAAQVFEEVNGTLAQLVWLSTVTTGWILILVIVLTLQLARHEVGLFRPPATVLGVVSGAARSVVVLTLFWAAVTILLAYAGAIGESAKSGNRAVKPWEAFSYYAWHFANGVPVLTIPETAGWKKPSLYEGLPARLWLLAYKLAVIVPAVAAVRRWWVMRRTSKGPHERVMRQIFEDPGLTVAELSSKTGLEVGTIEGAVVTLERRDEVRAERRDGEMPRYWPREITEETRVDAIASTDEPGRDEERNPT